MTREYTRKILEMVEYGLLDKDKLILDILNYMSEDEVKDMSIYCGYINEKDEEELNDADSNNHGC